MNYQPIQQLSPEWWALKKGKISGTRFGQVISGRKNDLLYDLIDENLSDHLFPDDYVSDDMQFGIDNEPIAIDLYEKLTGVTFQRGGVILSDFFDIHMASPDAVNTELGIVVEVKCTMRGKKQIKRFFDGVDTEYLPQIKNYFAVSDSVKQVHWISYCPARHERPLVMSIFTRADFNDEVLQGREKIREIQARIHKMEKEFIF